MYIQNLREFVVFGEHLNFSVAARALYISQPTLSQHISAMEEECGFPLIDRGKDGLRLTGSGELFLERAQNIINYYDRTIEDCKSRNQAVSYVRVQDQTQSVRFVSIFNQANELLNQKEPPLNFKLKLVPFGRRSLEDMLDKGSVDLGFMFAAHGSTKEIERLRGLGYDGFLLYTEPLFAYIDPNSELARKEIITPQDLSGKSFVALNLPAFSSFRRAIRETFENLGIKLNQKLLQWETPVDGRQTQNGEVLDDDAISIDLQQHVDSLEIIWGTVPYVKKPIERVDEGLDIYIVYNTSEIDEHLAQLLETLKETSKNL